jgi:hypothetical protein
LILVDCLFYLANYVNISLYVYAPCMHGKHESGWNKGRAILIIVLAIIVPYGLLMLRFSLRNDQIEYFLPVRMYMSDAFNHHEFMLWNPFMSGSYPLHSDMQGPVWNPVVILFSWLFNYNSTLLSIELLLYYLTGAIGCFYFARNFSRNIYSCIVIAVIYGCGGVATSILEYMSWVGSFAFLPWAVHFFYLLLKRKDLYTSIRFSIVVWLMLVSGYPSFLIYLGYSLLAAALAYFCLLYSQKRKNEIIGIVKYGLLSVFLFCVLSLPAIVSFYEYMPYYNRGTKALDVHINSEFFSWNYPLSLLFPVAGTLVFDNDIYIGLVPFLIICGSMNLRKKAVLTFRDKFLLTGGLFTFLFTLGRSTPVRMWSTRYLPLLDVFGFSHSVSIFLLLILFVWLAPGLDLFFSGETTGKGGEGLNRTNDRLSAVRSAACLAGLVLVICLITGYHRVAFRTNLIRSFYYVSAAWQLFLLAVFYFFSKKGVSAGRLFFFILADLCLSVFTVAPLTGFTFTSPGTYNRSAAAFYQSDAKEFLMSPVVRAAKISKHDPRAEVNALKLTGRDNFPSNTRYDSFINYIRDSGRYDKLLSLPFVFADNGTGLQVRHIELGYNFIDIDVKAENNCRMVIQQTYHKRWKADRPEYAPSAYEGVFLQTPLRVGENKVRLFYYKKDLFVEAGISLAMLVVLGALILTGYRRKGAEKGRLKM